MRRITRISVATGLVGASLALWLLLPLPPAGDLYAARRWGVRAGYVGFFLGFPLGVVGVPLTVALHPYPDGNDTSGAEGIATAVAVMVGVNWGGWAALAVTLTTVLRRRARGTNPTSRSSIAVGDEVDERS